MVVRIGSFIAFSQGFILHFILFFLFLFNFEKVLKLAIVVLAVKIRYYKDYYRKHWNFENKLENFPSYSMIFRPTWRIFMKRKIIWNLKIIWIYSCWGGSSASSTTSSELSTIYIRVVWTGMSYYDLKTNKDLPEFYSLFCKHYIISFIHIYKL